MRAFLIASAALTALAAAALPKVGTVCVVNDAAFIMDFQLKDMMTNIAGNTTSKFDMLRTECQFIKDVVPDVEHGDLIMPSVKAIAGDANTAVIYHNQTSEVATFSCRGTTLDYTCKLIQ